MLSIYRNMFKIPDLRGKIFFTLAMFAVYRFGAAIPVPGVDLENIEVLSEQTGQGGILGLLNLFSGNALENFSVLSLGILPYITASIIVQLLTVVIPKLQALQDEGESGRKVITQWTRYITIGLALLQSTTFSYLFHIGTLTGGIDLIPNYTPSRVGIIVITLTAGTAFIMWIGELITQRGVGNGISLIIFVSILAALPGQFQLLWQFTVANGRPSLFVMMVIAFFGMVVGILYVEQGQRRIPIQFAKRIRGRRVMGGSSTYIPLKVNMAGVIPVIFATSVLFFPVIFATSIPATGIFSSVRTFINDNLTPGGTTIGGTSWWYILFLFSLIVFFTYFHTAIQFDPVRQAETIQRQGGFIPGQRPGTQTARYLERILNRITLPGSIFLGLIAVLPAVASAIWGIPVGFSGVSILIVVGVALETMKQIESQLTMRNYEGFLT